jgi:hypothetical protein
MSPTERALAEMVSSKVTALQEAMARYEAQTALVAEEKAALARGQGVLEDAMRGLQRERAEFQKACAGERTKLDAWKAEEAGRIEKERRVAVRQARAAAAAEKALPDRTFTRLEQTRRQARQAIQCRHQHMAARGALPIKSG